MTHGIILVQYLLRILRTHYEVFKYICYVGRWIVILLSLAESSRKKKKRCCGTARRGKHRNHNNNNNDNYTSWEQKTQVGREAKREDVWLKVTYLGHRGIKKKSLISICKHATQILYVLCVVDKVIIRCQQSHEHVGYNFVRISNFSVESRIPVQQALVDRQAYSL